MMEVTVAKRRRSWEWRVCDHDGTLIMHGRERSRPAARYQGYRMLFMMLAVGRRSHEPPASEVRPASEASPHSASDLARLQRPARRFTPD
jgi:hypothetical protein